jgi:dolichol-phosphate mannosyltransferase
MSRVRVLVGTAIWNEGDKFRDLATKMHSFLASHQDDPEFEYLFLVVDDGSTDGVPEELADDPAIIWRRHGKNRGAGASVRTIYATARELGAGYAVTIAGNGKDEPEQIPRLLAPLAHERYDLVQGSRYRPGGGHQRMPLYRVMGTRYLHPVLMSVFTGHKVTDSTNGFRGLNLAVLMDPRFKLDQDWLDRYELESYLLYQCLHLGYRVTEVPVTKIYPERAGGYTKVAPVTGWWSLLRALFFLRLGIKQ